MILTLAFDLPVHLCQKPNIKYKLDVPYSQWYVSMTILSQVKLTIITSNQIYKYIELIGSRWKSRKWCAQMPLARKFKGSVLRGSAKSESIKWIHLLARSGLGKQIRLSLSLYNLHAMRIWMSVSYCHPKTNKLPLQYASQVQGWRMELHKCSVPGSNIIIETRSQDTFTNTSTCTDMSS